MYLAALQFCPWGSPPPNVIITLTACTLAQSGCWAAQAAGTPLDGGAEAALAELAEEAGQLRAVEEEVAGYAEAAIARSERLERENAALRKAAGDAELDKCVWQRSLALSDR